MILANQMTGQFGKMEDTILSNAATLFTGSNNNKNAIQKIASVINTNVQKLQGLKNYHIHYFSKNDKSYVFQVTDELVNSKNVISEEAKDKLIEKYYRPVEKTSDSKKLRKAKFEL